MQSMKSIGLTIASLLSIAFFYVIYDESHIIAQDPPAITTPAVGEPTKESLSKFRATLLKAADQAVKDKEITRLQAFKLRLATTNKATLERLHQATAEQVLTEGKYASYSAIDWNQLLAFIKELLPIILELIQMFSDTAACNPSFNAQPQATASQFCLAQPDHYALSA